MCRARWTRRQLKKETQGKKTGGGKQNGSRWNIKQEGGEARARFRVALTQDISLSDSRDRRCARLCLP